MLHVWIIMKLRMGFMVHKIYTKLLVSEGAIMPCGARKETLYIPVLIFTQFSV